MSYQDLVNSPVRRAVGDFLQTTIYKSKWFSFDFWSFIHLLVGGSIMAVLMLFDIKAYWKFAILFGLLVAYEIVELILINTTSNIFIPENLVNIVWDIIVGMLAGALVFLVFIMISLMR